MRDSFELDRGAQVGAVSQDANAAAVVHFEKLFEYQAGEQLVLGELLGAEAMCVGRPGALGRCLRGHQHALG